jgi:hypothetical protein
MHPILCVHTVLDSTLFNRSSTGLEAFRDRLWSVWQLAVSSVWLSAQIFARRSLICAVAGVNPTSCGVQIAQKGALPPCSQGNENLLAFERAVTAPVCASLHCHPVTHKISPSRLPSAHYTHQANTLLDPSGLASFPSTTRIPNPTTINNQNKAINTKPPSQG